VARKKSIKEAKIQNLMRQIPFLQKYRGQGLTWIIVMLFSMMFVLVFLSNYVEAKRVKLSKLKTEVERLKSEYMHVNSELERDLSPAVLLERTSQSGLEEFKEPIKVVGYTPEEYK